MYVLLRNNLYTVSYALSYMSSPITYCLTYYTICYNTLYYILYTTLYTLCIHSAARPLCMSTSARTPWSYRAAGGRRTSLTGIQVYMCISVCMYVCMVYIIPYKCCIHAVYIGVGRGTKIRVPPPLVTPWLASYTHTTWSTMIRIL